MRALSAACRPERARWCAPGRPCCLPGRRVLLVDDEPLMLATHSDLLALWGCEAVPAGCGAEALRRMREAGPLDAVVTDYRMPGMSGIALVEALRAERPRLPAIVVSADTPAAWPALQAPGSVTAWLVKPVPPAMLERHLVGALCGWPDAGACAAAAAA